MCIAGKADRFFIPRGPCGFRRCDPAAKPADAKSEAPALAELPGAAPALTARPGQSGHADVATGLPDPTGSTPSMGPDGFGGSWKTTFFGLMDLCGGFHVDWAPYISPQNITPAKGPDVPHIVTSRATAEIQHCKAVTL